MPEASTTARACTVATGAGGPHAVHTSGAAIPPAPLEVAALLVPPASVPVLLLLVAPARWPVASDPPQAPLHAGSHPASEQAIAIQAAAFASRGRMPMLERGCMGALAEGACTSVGVATHPIGAERGRSLA